MGWLKKGVAIIFAVAAAAFILQYWILLPIGIIVVLWLMRKIADAYWWQKDR